MRYYRYPTQWVDVDTGEVITHIADWAYILVATDKTNKVDNGICSIYEVKLVKLQGKQLKLNL